MLILCDVIKICFIHKFIFFLMSSSLNKNASSYRSYVMI